MALTPWIWEKDKDNDLNDEKYNEETKENDIKNIKTPTTTTTTTTTDVEESNKKVNYIRVISEVIYISEDETTWDENSKIFMKYGYRPHEIPFYIILQDNKIVFPIIGIDITKLCDNEDNSKIISYCLICSCEKQTNIPTGSCQAKEEHYPYISLLPCIEEKENHILLEAPFSIPTETIEKEKVILESLSSSPQQHTTVKKPKKKTHYIFICPIQKENNQFKIQKIDSHYWFFLACILSSIHLPHALKLFRKQDDDNMYIIDGGEKTTLLRNITHYLIPKQIQPSLKQRKNVYLTETFPLLPYLKTQQLKKK